VVPPSIFPRMSCKSYPPIHSNNSMWPARSLLLPSLHVSPLLNPSPPFFAPSSPRKTTSLLTSRLRSSLSILLSPTPPISSPGLPKRRSDPGFFTWFVWILLLLFDFFALTLLFRRIC